jgi:hypothetical protein
MASDFGICWRFFKRGNMELRGFHAGLFSKLFFKFP